MKAWKHFCTVHQHRKLVRQGCFRIGLYWQGFTHDLSKYSFREFIPGCKYYTGVRSPNDGQRRKEGYSSAWLHHKGRNKHHFEYWIDYSADRNVEHMIGLKMPRKYVAEMFCDRLAACKVYRGKEYTDRSAYEYYEMTASRMLIHEDTKEELRMLLSMNAEKGEEETFRFIREEYLPGAANASVGEPGVKASLPGEYPK